jgi:hypothetical protein
METSTAASKDIVTMNTTAVERVDKTLQSVVAMIGKVLKYLETIESRVEDLEGDHEGSAGVEDLEGDHDSGVEDLEGDHEGSDGDEENTWE